MGLRDDFVQFTTSVTCTKLQELRAKNITSPYFKLIFRPGDKMPQRSDMTPATKLMAIKQKGNRIFFEGLIIKGYTEQGVNVSAKMDGFPGLAQVADNLLRGQPIWEMGATECDS